jgi:small-conductance mechanosensitive channel
LKSLLRIFMISLALVLFSLLSAANAQTLEEYERQLNSYQTAPMERVKQLHMDLAKISGMEIGIAQQNEIPITMVFEYEQAIEHAINEYHSVYFFQKRPTGRNSFLLDDESIRNIEEKKPPYSFLFYLGLIQDVETCQYTMRQKQASVETYKRNLVENARRKNYLEKQYRLYLEKINTDGDDSLKTNWKFEEAKVKLEECFAIQIFNETALKARQAAVNEIGEKLKILVPALDRIRSHLTYDEDDFRYLDALVIRKTQELTGTIKMLDDKYATFDKMRNSATNKTRFEKYWIVGEQQLVEEEVLLLLDVIEDWSSMKMVWNGMADLLKNNLGIEDQQKLLDRVNNLITRSDKDEAYCMTELAKLQEANDIVDRMFDSKEHNADVTSEDMLMRNEFIENLKARQDRYQRYIIDIGKMRRTYLDLRDETKRIMNNDDIQDKIHTMWYQKLSALVNFELWHIGDYPITLGRFLYAILIFIIGYIITRYISHFIRKKMRRNDRMTLHSTMLIYHLVNYIGFLVAFLLALASLRIPFTAFAFAGGAVAIAFGLGAQKLMGDVVSGLLMLFQNRIHVGDEVIVNGQRGTVKEISLQNTVILCEQSKHLIIPNSKFFDQEVINLTMDNSIVRTSVETSVAYKTDVDKAMEIIKRVLSKDSKVLKQPPFTILFDNFADSSIKLTALFFVDISKNQYQDIISQSTVRRNILEAFAQADIEIPFPQTEITIKNDSNETKQ